VILVSTVWHSGTHSLQKQLGESELRHCCPEIFDDLDKYDSIATTYRDPLRVAASWGNRDRFINHEHYLKRTWYRQWECWHQIKEIATVYPVGVLGERINIFEDKKGLHKALDEDDMEHFYKHVPIKAIEFAQCQLMP